MASSEDYRVDSTTGQSEGGTNTSPSIFTDAHPRRVLVWPARPVGTFSSARSVQSPQVMPPPLRQKLPQRLLSDRSYEPMMVSLVDNYHLWSQFSQHSTEMIIAKSGRLMFPTIKLKLENLKPDSYYMMFLELTPTDNFRYKFERDFWAPKIKETTLSTEWLMHPQSPAQGRKWMEKPIDFPVKLTNCPDDNNGKIFLQSMHKYSITIHVVEGSEVHRIDKSKTRKFPLGNTTFIAVTTYQNQKIKDLKTEKNIHAKGIQQKKMKLMEDEGSKENSEGTSKKPRSAFTAPILSDFWNKSPSMLNQCAHLEHSPPNPSSSNNAPSYNFNNRMSLNDSFYHRFYSQKNVPVTESLRVVCPPLSTTSGHPLCVCYQQLLHPQPQTQSNYFTYPNLPSNSSNLHLSYNYTDHRQLSLSPNFSLPSALFFSPNYQMSSSSPTSPYTSSSNNIKNEDSSSVRENSTLSVESGIPSSFFSNASSCLSSQYGVPSSPTEDSTFQPVSDETPRLLQL